ncbi:MAG: hypothetical protein KatS3mg121_1009 [Gammaproteobacteria bacterium]|nr:MAG: hypothetical protein KatS3mg121_1009 [Gammaproteobacteria bacterium]
MNARAFGRLALAAAAWLAACATPPPRPPAPEDVLAARRAALASLRQWRAEGRLALQAAEGSGGLSFHWRQDGARFDLQLVAPFGNGRWRVHGDGRRLVWDLDGERLDGEAGRLWLRERLGWDGPVERLGEWLLAAPRDGRVQRADRFGRPLEIAGAGWRAHYSRYLEVGRRSLPGRVEVEGEGWRIKIAVRRWTVY